MEQIFRALLLKTKKGISLKMALAESYRNLLSRDDDRSNVIGACRFSVNPDRKQFRFYGSDDEFGGINSLEDFERAIQSFKEERGSMIQYKLAQYLYSLQFITNLEEDFTKWEFIPPESAK